MNSSKTRPDYTPEEIQALDQDLVMTFNRNVLANQKADEDDSRKCVNTIDTPGRAATMNTVIFAEPTRKITSGRVLRYPGR